MKTINKICGLAVLALALTVAPAWAGSEPIQFAGWLGASIGVRYLDVGGINDYLDDVNLGPLSPLWPTIGGQARGLVFEKLIIGLQGGGSYLFDEGRDVDVHVASAYGELMTGFVVHNGRGGLAYPFIGLGGHSLALHFEGDLQRLNLDLQPGETRDGSAPTVVVRDSATINKGVLYATVGFSYFFPVRFGASDFGPLGFFLPGITVGGNIQMLESGWRDEGEAYRGGPSAPYHSFFVALEVAFGGGTTWKPRKDSAMTPASAEQPVAATPVSPEPAPPPPSEPPKTTDPVPPEPPRQ
jgi:hypothetical protein